MAIDAPLAYVHYAKCAELGLPIFVSVGVAGPRVPSLGQHVEHLDQVMYDFPELVVVMRHGAKPWTDLAVKLMLKWPNLYYSTSAFAPRHYPKEIVDYANTRGGHKIIYADFPHGSQSGTDIRRDAPGRVQAGGLAAVPGPERCGRIGYPVPSLTCLIGTTAT